MSDVVALHEPVISGKEWQYVKECLDTAWVSSVGEYVDRFERDIAEYTGSKHAIACVNGTAALQVSLRLAGVKGGDEVIVPTITFIATVNAVTYNGAVPVFMDADEHFNIDGEKTIEFIINDTVVKEGYSYNRGTGRRVRAIVPVHIFGNAARLDDLIQVCEPRNIAVVEDAAESLGTRYIEGEYAGRHTGTLGLLGCLSFNGNKIITTGGGGMILTDDPELAERARYLTTQAKDDKSRYVHNEVGYNFRLTNIQAAVGVAQLEQLVGFLKSKREIFCLYRAALGTADGLSLAPVPEYANNNHWMTLLHLDRVRYPEGCADVIRRLEGSGIQTRAVWTVNHKQRPYRGCQSHKIEKAMGLVENSLCVPSALGVSERDIRQVVDLLCSLGCGS